MRISELKKMVKKAMDNAENSVETLGGNDNPQVIEVRQTYIGQLEAFTAVYEAMHNDTIALRILGMRDRS